jgi:tryptophan synthase alpha chain
MSAATSLRNALDDRLQATRSAGDMALVMYLTAGFPDADSTLRWGPLLAKNGASIIELGIPFSDPLGDGPTIQRSSQVALSAGMTLRGSLDLAAAIHSTVDTPVVLMSYCNPLFRMGVQEFATAAAFAGVTGVIVPDLPIEESSELAGALAAAGIHLIYLLSPASTEERIRRTAAAASGFIYSMALTGVTGARATLSEGLPDFLGRVRALTDVPLVVGFGVSKPEHIRRLAAHADGAVVASALVDLVERMPADARDAAIAAFVRELHASCSGS